MLCIGKNSECTADREWDLAVSDRQASGVKDERSGNAAHNGGRVPWTESARAASLQNHFLARAGHRDRTYTWATEQNYLGIPQDDFLNDLQCRMSWYLYKKGIVPNLQTQFSGRFGVHTKKLFLQFLHTRGIDYDPQDFDEKSEHIIVRGRIIDRIFDIDFPATTELDGLMDLGTADAAAVERYRAILPHVDVKTIAAVYRAAVIEGIPPDDLFVLIGVESDYSPSAVNRESFKGLGQLNLTSIHDVLVRNMGYAGARAMELAYMIYYDHGRILAPEMGARLAAKYYTLCRAAVGTSSIDLIYLAYNQGVAATGPLVRQFGADNAEAIWQNIGMRGSLNDKALVRKRVEKFKALFK
ncbi:MAG: transglycosylase SLT domain-containing protein [Deltaproteobacteria bacterium]|nr:transglycosylase SLT domain-containing protein [Deltaproteobacteria bacterium]